MAQEDVGSGPGDWTAMHAAVSAEQLLDDEGRKYLAMLRHPTYPFCGLIAPACDMEAALRDIATAYIARVQASYRVTGDDPPPLGNAGCLLAAADPDGFGWLDIGWGEAAGQRDPRLSFWVARVAGDNSGPSLDRTLVLLAANRRVDDGSQRCEGQSVGLRVVMHVATQPAAGCGRLKVRVTGLSTSRLWLARPPNRLLSAPFLELRVAVAAKAELTFGFQPSSAQLSGGFSLAVQGPHEVLTFSGTGRLNESGDAARVFEWSAVVNFANGGALQFLPQSRVEQASHAVGMAFQQDAASLGPAASELERRPSQPECNLDRFRLPSWPLPASPLTLIDLDNPPRFQVQQSQLADLHNDPAAVQQIDLAQLPLRSDDLSAFHAFLRGMDLFGRLKAYGLTAGNYFKLAKLPLVLRHRAWFFTQPDGLTVNAEVRPDGESQSLFENFDVEKRPHLEVRFGAANLEHRRELADKQGHPRAQPMGLAADPRWAWHEFGHVLSYAATGALEFHFAHSAGDALAAIVADPASRLSMTAVGMRDTEMGGLTFPWVQMARRHDRDANAGWCWCGQRNGQRKVHFRLPAPLFKGYVEEQMLSSSLFMLYRVLGGDSFTLPLRRHAASDYCIYLVMRAIALLGPAAVVPALSADAFVSVLIDADIGTGVWSLQLPSDPDIPPWHPTRLGGTVHKAVRWAFEQQGLFATDQPYEWVEGTGLPPIVDLYIPGQCDRLEGGYAPVDLNWAAKPDQVAPPWHADPSGLWREDSEVVMKVSNRGQCTATNLAARAWAAPAEVDPLQWQALEPAAVQLHTSISALGVGEFRFRAEQANGDPLTGKWFVLVEIDCPEDRANLNPEAMLACSADDLPPNIPDLLVDLVANDNNLGLRCIDFD